MADGAAFARIADKRSRFAAAVARAPMMSSSVAHR